MTTVQKIIKYLAIALAAFLSVSIIGGVLGTLGILGGLFNNQSPLLSKTKIYSIGSKINSLDIEINAANFTIKTGDVFSVESNLKNLTVNEKDGVLTIRDEIKFVQSYSDASLILYIPSNYRFDKVNLLTGAGQLSVTELYSKVLSLELGAGQVNINSLFATQSADIDGGAGKVTISNSNISNLDLDMGVGQLNFSSKLSGKSELDLGVGQTNITLMGELDSYLLDLDKGLGSITVDGRKVSDETKLGSGQSLVEISGGVGDISILFNP